MVFMVGKYTVRPMVFVMGTFDPTWKVLFTIFVPALFLTGTHATLQALTPPGETGVFFGPQIKWWFFSQETMEKSPDFEGIYRGSENMIIWSDVFGMAKKQRRGGIFQGSRGFS